MDTGASEEELVGKKKTNGSIIWRWFGFKVSDEQQNNVFCRECRKSVATKGSSTTNLYHHLQLRHKVQYEECVKLRAVAQTAKSSEVPAVKQTTLQHSYTRAVPYDTKSEKWGEITKAVAYHIAKDMVPISTVEQEGFIQLLKTLDRRYQLPSRKYFTREALPKMYTDVRQSLAAQLTKVSHFALTTDMWSSRTCEPYMSVTIHFMEDWELKTACLQTSYFPQDHTGEHIAEALQDVLKTWKLNPTGLVAITTDNGANIVKAVQLNKWSRIQCFGHRLHLAIGKCNTEFFDLEKKTLINEKCIESLVELNMPMDHKTNIFISHSQHIHLSLRNRKLVEQINKLSLLNPINVLGCICLCIRLSCDTK